MKLLMATNKVPFSLALGIKTQKPEMITIIISSIKKPNTVYIRRQTEVNGSREYHLNLPQSPDGANVYIFNSENGNLPPKHDPSFQITKFETENLQQCPIKMKNGTEEFVDFAQWFSENAGILSAGRKDPSTYRSYNGKFQIDYFNQIFDRETGQFLSTPARIGHTSGIIEVAKKDFQRYTVPMRMIILLHEYAHKYLNPEVNKPIGYETGADINALNIYLALGYPPAEAYYAFLVVFKDSNNAENAKRYHILNDFIKKFTNGEIDGSCKLKTNIGGSN